MIRSTWSDLSGLFALLTGLISPTRWPFHPGGIGRRRPLIYRADLLCLIREEMGYDTHDIYFHRGTYRCRRRTQRYLPAWSSPIVCLRPIIDYYLSLSWVWNSPRAWKSSPLSLWCRSNCDDNFVLVMSVITARPNEFRQILDISFKSQGNWWS